MADALVNVLVVITAQCVCVLIIVVHPEYIQLSFVPHTLIKLEGGKEGVSGMTQIRGFQNLRKPVFVSGFAILQ